jgi:hypothetical protein
MKYASICRVGVACALVSSFPAAAYTLWSTSETYLGTGEFQGPGVNQNNEPLFCTVIRNMMFVSDRDFVTPFENNGPQEPNIHGESQMSGTPDGKLSDGTLINENVDTCAAKIADVKILPAAIPGGLYMGEQVSATLDNGDVTMAFDIALDLGVGGKGVVRVPFYGTTGEITVPRSLQSQMGGQGIDQAGIYPSGTRLKGRIGDFNHDGWIDGTLVAAGVMPLDSPFYPGQPYVIVRHFETNIPIQGEWSGNVKALQPGAAKAAPRQPVPPETVARRAR